MSSPSTSTDRIHVRWLSPTWPTATRSGSICEPLRDPALEPDRDVAEAARPVAVVEQRARDDADRVREVDDPRAGLRALAHAVRDLEHHRHGAHRLREAAGARRLLADAAARERHRLVPVPRRLAADPDLDEHEVGAVDGRVEIAGDVEDARVAGVVEHAPRHRADDVARALVDVVQRQPVEPEPVALAGEAGDELRRVGRAGADDGDPHVVTPVSVTPDGVGGTRSGTFPPRRRASGVRGLVRDAQDRAHEAVVAGAAAEVAREARCAPRPRTGDGLAASSAVAEMSMPGVQNPHCTPPSSRKAHCSGDSSSSSAEALDGGELAAVGLHREVRAGVHRPAVERASCRRRTRSRRSPPWSRSDRATSRTASSRFRCGSTSTG